MKLLKCDGIKYHWLNPNTGERQYCLYFNLSILFRGESRTSATYKMNLFVTIVTASNHWLLSQKAASFQSCRGPQSTNAKGKKSTTKNMVSNRSHGHWQQYGRTKKYIILNIILSKGCFQNVTPFLIFVTAFFLSGSSNASASLSAT